MIDPNKLIEFLVQRGVHFFSGVPDSLLKAFCLAIGSNKSGLAHRIASNEGCAVGMAMGHYLSTRTLPVVYMQNSGLGNAINPPLLSGYTGCLWHSAVTHYWLAWRSR
ncbi:thiamine pyrophosphate-binding protein [Pectobacterium versatile]|uniref:thiamine pyrophosphate-binding protein n=1 Tax=Pectobacterium versatile TaxID=2488639 RepID=UPI0030173DCE